MVEHPVLLLILDGWGKTAPGPGNAISQAHTPNLDRLMASCPGTTLECMGPAVGLPPGQMGNSEVGHLNLGAGRIVYQDIMRINMAVEDGSLRTNEVVGDLIDTTRAQGGRLHFMGLISDGGVHSDQAHLLALLAVCKEKGLTDVVVHAFLDGRDTPPASGRAYVQRLQADMDSIGVGRIATVSGRFYAMDRDKRWERIELAYDALTLGKGIACSNPLEAIEAAYAQGENDEFVKPRVIMDNGCPVGCIEDGDAVFFFNFRADRARIAETEKYAHVTYFFNGGREEPFDGEDRHLVPSPREVATYDLKPEMSVHEVARILCETLRNREHRLIICNFANLDMVGHTGVIPAVIAACEAVDGCVGQVMQTLEEVGGWGLVTADHGNAEEMLDESGGVKTSHSLNPVPCLLVGRKTGEMCLRPQGGLCDVAPTLLEMMGLAQPEEMTGTSLLQKNAG
jgi:2,3-bisphosphoglycerate-independent phosphoglycerate mutase